MQGPVQSGSDDELPIGPQDPDRSWVHPSEVGLHRRARTDRRRGAWLAAVVVTAGVGLLVVGVGMGRGGRDSASTTSGPRTDGVASGLASLTIVTGSGRLSATGVVMDGDGHVVTRAPIRADDAEVWASCGGRQPERVSVAAHDAQTGITILTLPAGSGRPVVPASKVAPGDDVLLARAGRGESGPVIESGTLGVVGLRFVDLMDTATSSRLLGVTSVADSAAPTATTPAADTIGPGVDGAAFDQRGRFIGLVAGTGSEGSTSVLPAATVLGVLAEHLG